MARKIRHRNRRLALLLAALMTLAGPVAGAAEKETTLSLDEFIRQATRADTAFEEILLDELRLQYQRDLVLPPGNLVLSVKQSYAAFASGDGRGPATRISLQRLFPSHGTELEIAYEASQALASDNRTGSFGIGVSQPIARNAFGRATGLLDKITGLEVEVAHFQIVEAYEDYLATVVDAYYRWYEAYENLAIGKSAYAENRKLLEDIRKRQTQQIALPVDVNKIRLQVLAKQEDLVGLREALASSLQVVETIIRHTGGAALRPVAPATPVPLGEPFESLLSTFQEQGRTFSILRKLEQRSSLSVDREADDLLPSINLIAGYEVRGRDYGLKDSDDRLFAGIELELSRPDAQQKAELEVARILARKAPLATKNTYYRLRQQLSGLYLEIQRESELARLAGERIALARQVVRDEAENYTYGKISLNDYIQAVNVVDVSRFSRIRHESLLRRGLLEWQRLTDTLVTRDPVLQSREGLPSDHR
jgi:outer membrane protein TolC